MIHDGCGPANYTAWQNNFCLSFSRAHRSTQWTPFFTLIVEIILVRKSRKTLRSCPPFAGQVSFFLLVDSFSSLPQCCRYESEYA